MTHHGLPTGLHLLSIPQESGIRDLIKTKVEPICQITPWLPPQLSAPFELSKIDLIHALPRGRDDSSRVGRVDVRM